MIIRVLSAQIGAPNVAEANGLMRRLLADLERQTGLTYAKLARRLLENDDEEIILFEEWLTPADLFEWTGGALHTPRLPDGGARLLDGLVISHYESLDRLPDESELAVLDTDERPGAGEAESA